MPFITVQRNRAQEHWKDWERKMRRSIQYASRGYDRVAQYPRVRAGYHGYRTCDRDGPRTTQRTPTQPNFPAKNSHLLAEKVKEIEYWLTEEGDDGSLEAYVVLPLIAMRIFPSLVTKVGSP